VHERAGVLSQNRRLHGSLVRSQQQQQQILSSHTSDDFAAGKYKHCHCLADAVA